MVSRQSLHHFQKKGFEASSPVRHGTDLNSSLLERIGVKSMLFPYTDGGYDHCLTYDSLQLALIALFLNLNLHILVAGRTALHHSCRDPIKQIMYIVNMKLQCVGILLTKGSDEFEEAIKNDKTFISFANLQVTSRRNTTS